MKDDSANNRTAAITDAPVSDEAPSAKEPPAGRAGRKNQLFTRKSIAGLLWPLVVEQLLLVLVGVVDVWMVSAVGEAAISGVALVDSVNYLFIQIIFALTAGGTVVCAQFIGAADHERASKSVAQLLMFSVCVMTLATVVLLVGGRGLLALLFGQVEQGVMDNALIYLQFTVASFPFMAAYYSAVSSFRAKGNTRISMRMAMFMNVLNVVGNAICIFGLHMGVMGVALPTLIARAVSAVVVMWLLQRPGNDLRIRSFGQLRPDRGILRKILAIGVPNSVESGLFNVGKVLLQSLVATLGTASIAAYAVAGSLVTFLYLPGNAIGAGMITVVGQCHGAGDAAQGKSYARQLLYVNYAMLLVLCIGMVAGIDVWVGLYQLSGPGAEATKQLVVAHSIAMIIWPTAFTLPQYFRAVGHATFTMVVAVVTMLVLRIGLAYLFVLVLGKDVLWIWYAMFIDWLVRTVVFLVAFLRSPPTA